ncbi:glycosyltransferase [Pararobbsia silviterrae]|uniref:Glycosyltransferase n=1 Tax=Pararobbsia silviterrae TaxID=1792498 RepID=A0A494Y8W5_9BURK|nr:glycosyltransferase [Pararobbsia silviterrae]RKP59122.1 glycosyltransferase [Pararobbsia silviterrae]
MRIVHLANHCQLIGNGIVNMMVDLACSQADAGHDVVVATSGGRYEPLLAAHGVRHVVLEQSRDPWRTPAMVLGFNRLLRDVDPDVVHAHMMTGAIIARFGTWRRRYALVTTVHNEFQKSASLMRYGDRVVAVTQAVEKAMIGRGIRADRICTVLNGTVGTPRRAQASTADPLRLSRPSITTVAGMYERKGIQDLLRAFASLRATHPDATLYLVGDGPDRADMEALAAELGLEGWAHFAGFDTNPVRWLAETDVFVLASHKEPGGLVLSEAREAGCAIVATDVDGNPEMLDRGEAGWLVPARAPDALAAAIGSLLGDAALRADYAARARRNLDKFTVQRVANDYMAVYATALDVFRQTHGRRPRTALRSS